MANVYFGKVQTNNEYVDYETLDGASALTTGTSYLMQFQGAAGIYVGTTKPTGDQKNAGFVLLNGQIFQYTPNGTDKLWVKSFGAVAYLNVAT